MANTSVTVQDGKYTFIIDEKTGSVSALRYGKPWIDAFSDGGQALIALIYEVEDLRRMVSKEVDKEYDSLVGTIDVDGNEVE